MAIKNKLKEIRMKEYLMSGKEFADMLVISHTTYNNWELGVSKPTLDKAFEIAEKLNKKVDEIWYKE